MDKEMERLYGEAHLYAAVAKADGIVSSKESLKAGYFAEKSQEVMNIMGINNRVREGVKGCVNQILSEEPYSSWSAQDHIDRGLELLRRARDRGEPGIDSVVEKNREGLYKLALSDGYVIKEKKILDKIKGAVISSDQ